MSTVSAVTAAGEKSTVVVVVVGGVVVDVAGGREVVDSAVVVVLDVIVELEGVVVLDDGSLDADDEHAPRTTTVAMIVAVRAVRRSDIPIVSSYMEPPRRRWCRVVNVADTGRRTRDIPRPIPTLAANSKGTH